jgi:hypothetical protein
MRPEFASHLHRLHLPFQLLPGVCFAKSILVEQLYFKYGSFIIFASSE